MLTLIFVISSCQKDVDKERNRLVDVIGHGGNGLTIPTNVYTDNTKEAFELAKNTYRCNGFEMDVQMSKDGELWLFHDFNMKRTTLKKKALNEYVSEELSQARYTSVHREKLMRLSEIKPLMSFYKTYFLDIKLYNETTNSLVDTALFLQKLVDYRIDNPYYVNFFVTQDIDFGKRMQAKGLRVFFSCSTEEEALRFLADEVPFEGVMLRNELASADLVQKIKNNSYQIALFDIRSPIMIRKAFAKQPNYLLVDDIKAAIIEKG